jgi:Ca2+-transporting ATPase
MDLSQELPPKWHAVEPQAVVSRLGGGSAGLAAAEAKRRLDWHGRNELPQARRRGMALVLLDQFRSPFIYLLLAAAALSLLLRHFADAGFVLVVLVMNAAIGAWQEWGAEQRIRSLQTLVRSVVTVRRDGAARDIDSRELVPGDIVLCATGLRIPADLRLISGRDLVVDESLLTGESHPVFKRAAPAAASEAVLGDRHTMLHAGTPILSGRGEAVVVATGAHTELGRIARSLAENPAPPTPLTRRMAGFTRVVSVAVVAVIAILAAIEIGRGAPIADILLIAIALAVSAIPEGLPVAMTVALSVAVRRMAQRNVIIRRLPAVEGLGSCTVIASDKTGTLTLNSLTIEKLWLPGIGQVDADDPRGHALATSGAICNEASLGPDGGSDRGRGGASGDSVDIAFLSLAHRHGVLAAARRLPIATALCYEPERKFAAALVDEAHKLVHVKGAPETVFAMCRDVPLAAHEAATSLAAAGYRLIAVAAGAGEGVDLVEPRGLRLLGLAAIIDPLRPDAADAIAAARGAGIRVCMVTGDHPRTALTIARQLGLARDAGEVMTGSELAALDEGDFAAAVDRARVFARVEPLQKLKIVEAMRAAGHVVAVTGDGVNDAPALRAADIGVAMAGAGTDVAREAADILLVDDNFASIVHGVEEGRFAYDNIRKVIFLVVSTGAAEIILFVLATLTGLPPPLTAVQLLWLNLVTNGIQDVALAFEKGEPGALARKPRPPGSPVFDRRMIEQTALSGMFIGGVSFFYYRYMLDAGLAHAAAQNALLWLLVCFENAHCLNCRSERRSVLRIPLSGNWLIVIGILAAQGLQLVAMATPGLNQVLGVAPLEFGQWLLLAGLALTIVPLMEGYKVLARHLLKSE